MLRSAAGFNAGPQELGERRGDFFRGQDCCSRMVRLTVLLSDPFTSFRRHGNQSRDLFFWKTIASHRRRQTDVACFREQEERIVYVMRKVRDGK